MLECAKEVVRRQNRDKHEAVANTHFTCIKLDVL